MSKNRRRAASAQEPPKARPPARRRRRPGLPLLAGLGLGLAAVVIAAGRYLLRQPAWHPERQLDQNVLLITLDTTRADALSCYGGRAATPNLDRLAALGARFEFAHAHAVVTLPSHASILTGLYPSQHGIHDNNGYRLPVTIPTLSAMLKPHGFATGAFVGAFPVDSRFGLNQGFDVYDDRYPGTSMNNEFKFPERRAEDVIRPALRWIQGQRGRWFAWVHLFDPHAPYAPPPPFNRQYADQPYYGETAYADYALGPLFDTVSEQHARPTLIVVTGDHGEALGDHGERTHGLFAYEATLRVPLIMAQLAADGPAWNTIAAASKRAGAGQVVSDPARHVDLVPTLLDVLGLPIPGPLPGRSLLADGGRERSSYFEALSASLNRGWAPLRGVLKNRDKYIDLPIPELYSLETDPAERANVVDVRADERRVLEALLRAAPTGGAGTARVQDPEATARLQALGYVGGNVSPKSKYTANDDPKRLIRLDQQIHEGIEVYQRKGPREAIPIFQAIVAARPSMELGYLHLSQLQWEIGQPRPAIGTLDAAVRAGIDTLSIRTRLGVYLAESGAVSQALPLLREAATANPPDIDALNALGIALGRAGKREAAVATFNRILQLNPSNAMALENLGSIALTEGRLADARRDFRLALESDPASAQAHNGLGVVELKSGNRKAAIEHWKAAVARDPTNYDALYNVAIELVADGRPREARPYLERFVQTAPPAFYAKDIQRVKKMVADSR